MTNSDQTHIYVDGACDPNPGPGAWAVIIQAPNSALVELSGAEPDTTNNRMEMQAVLEALLYVQTNGLNNVTIFSDSRLVVFGITGQWKREANTDLWAKMVPLFNSLRPTVTWVKGHSGVKGNEDADQLATKTLTKAFGTHTARHRLRKKLAKESSSPSENLIKTSNLIKMPAEPERSATKTKVTYLINVLNKNQPDLPRKLPLAFPSHKSAVNVVKTLIKETDEQYEFNVEEVKSFDLVQ